VSISFDDPNAPGFDISTALGRVDKRAYELAPDLWAGSQEIDGVITVGLAGDEPRLVATLGSEFPDIVLRVVRASTSIARLRAVEMAIAYRNDHRIIALGIRADENFRLVVRVGLHPMNTALAGELQESYGDLVEVYAAIPIVEL